MTRRSPAACLPLSPRAPRGELTRHRGLLLRSVPVFFLLLWQLPELREVRLQQLGNRLVGQAGGKRWRRAPGGGGPGVRTLGSAPRSRDNPRPLPLGEVLPEGVAAARTPPVAMMGRWTSGPWGAGWPSRQHHLRGGASLGLGGDPWTCELSLLDKRPDVQPQTAPGPQYQPGSPAGWGDLRIKSCVLQILSPAPRNVTRRGSLAVAEATSYKEVPRGRGAPMQSCWRPY